MTVCILVDESVATDVMEVPAAVIILLFRRRRQNVLRNVCLFIKNYKISEPKRQKAYFHKHSRQNQKYIHNASGLRLCGLILEF
jgi:hypothetical protein